MCARRSALAGRFITNVGKSANARTAASPHAPLSVSPAALSPVPPRAPPPHTSRRAGGPGAEWLQLPRGRRPACALGRKPWPTASVSPASTAPLLEASSIIRPVVRNASSAHSRHRPASSIHALPCPPQPVPSPALSAASGWPAVPPASAAPVVFAPAWPRDLRPSLHAARRECAPPDEGAFSSAKEPAARASSARVQRRRPGGLTKCTP